jgi:hypothetical protein
MEGRRATTTTNKRNPKYNLESASSLSSLSCKEDVEEGFIYVEKESNNLNTNSRNSNGGTMLLNKRSKSVGDDFLEINGNEIVELEELEGRIEVNEQQNTRDDYDDG